ncbi:hypothetical protein Hamer_G015662 [Homarus americanus]|uniref:Uncharacterized protein n=1 Tax=Homarus americanus TaxID=6706 RepID=A0A8J5MKS0_HOMAM|nr:hypothetical protein Hamer_G015662 [Homarus americanus]
MGVGRTVTATSVGRATPLAAPATTPVVASPQFANLIKCVKSGSTKPPVYASTAL